MGYNWNETWAEVKKERLHGQDGRGLTRLEKVAIEELDSEPLKVIFRHIFATHPGMEEIAIID